MLLKVTTLLLVFIFSKCSYVPLQLQAPVTIYSQSGNFYLQYQVLKTAIIDVAFCFMQNDVSVGSGKPINQSTLYSCSIKDKTTSYKCVRFYSDSTNIFYKQQFQKQINSQTIWTSVSNSQNNVSTPISSLSQSLGSINIISQALTQTLQFKNYFNFNSIYHMYTCPSFNSATGQCNQMWKQNYIHTFIHPQKKINLIVQRINVCVIISKNGQNITNHVFFGGTIRNNQNYMFFAVLSYLSDSTKKLNMWGGISYSGDHASRDMFCYANDGSNFDAVSLIAGPVYKDTATNIEGTDDVEVLDNFYSENNKNYHTYFIQYTRPYVTANSYGDQKLFQKIYANYSFAAYFQTYPATQKNIKAPSCLSKAYKHNFSLTFPADVRLQEVLANITKLILIFLAYVLLIM